MTFFFNKERILNSRGGIGKKKVDCKKRRGCHVTVNTIPKLALIENVQHVRQRIVLVCSLSTTAVRLFYIFTFGKVFIWYKIYNGVMSTSYECIYIKWNRKHEKQHLKEPLKTVICTHLFLGYFHRKNVLHAPEDDNNLETQVQKTPRIVVVFETVERTLK